MRRTRNKTASPPAIASNVPEACDTCYHNKVCDRKYFLTFSILHKLMRFEGFLMKRLSRVYVDAMPDARTLRGLLVAYCSSVILRILIISKDVLCKKKLT